MMKREFVLNHPEFAEAIRKYDQGFKEREGDFEQLDPIEEQWELVHEFLEQCDQPKVRELLAKARTHICVISFDDDDSDLHYTSPLPPTAKYRLLFTGTGWLKEIAPIWPDQWVDNLRPDQLDEFNSGKLSLGEDWQKRRDTFREYLEEVGLEGERKSDFTPLGLDEAAELLTIGYWSFMNGPFHPERIHQWEEHFWEKVFDIMAGAPHKDDPTWLERLSHYK
jgi:hypothetical protein